MQTSIAQPMAGPLPSTAHLPVNLPVSVTGQLQQASLLFQQQLARLMAARSMTPPVTSPHMARGNTSYFSTPVFLPEVIAAALATPGTCGMTKSKDAGKRKKKRPGSDKDRPLSKSN